MTSAYAQDDGATRAAPTFDLGAAFRWGWETTRANLAPLAIVTLVAALVMSVPGAILQSAFPRGIMNAFAQLVSFVGQTIGTLGLCYVGLRLYDEGTAPTVRDLFVPLSVLPAGLGAGILNALLVMVGFVLLVVPGLIVLVGFSFYAWVLLDRNVGAIDALSASWELTRGHRWTLFVAMLLSLLVIVLGALALGVGLLVAVPVVVLAWAYLYRQVAPRDG